MKYCCTYVLRTLKKLLLFYLLKKKQQQQQHKKGNQTIKIMLKLCLVMKCDKLIALYLDNGCKKNKQIM